MMPLTAGRSAECLQDGTDHILSMAIQGTMDDSLWTACCLNEEWKGILRKKENGEDISPVVHVRIVAALKLSALNKKLSAKKCLP